MDHAGDIISKAAPALQAAGFPVTEDPGSATREHRELIVQTRDSGEWYRLTVEAIQPTDDELYWPTYGSGRTPSDPIR